MTVTQVTGDMVTLDGNHPLAGKNLNFEVEIAAVRAATAEELRTDTCTGRAGTITEARVHRRARQLPPQPRSSAPPAARTAPASHRRA